MKYALTTAALLLLFAISALGQSKQMSVQEIEPLFQEASAATGVDVRLLRVVAWIESRNKPRAVSYKDGKPCAYGLMQLIPSTASRFGVLDVFDPRQNIHGGARYLRYLLGMFNGDVSLTLAAYNAGEGAVLKYGRRVPPYRETVGYVKSGWALLARSGLPAAYQRERSANETVNSAHAVSESPAVEPPSSLPPASSFLRRASTQVTVESTTKEAEQPGGNSVSFVRRAPARLSSTIEQKVHSP